MTTVTKTEIASALNILLAALSEQSNKADAEKILESMLTDTGFEPEAALETLKLVRILERKHGTIDEMDERLDEARTAMKWWDQNGEEADEMAELYNTCAQYSLDTQEINKVGRALKFGEIENMQDAFECYDTLGEYDSGDVVEVMDFLANHCISVEEIKEIIRDHKKYQAIAEIVNGDR